MDTNSPATNTAPKATKRALNTKKATATSASSPTSKPSPSKCNSNKTASVAAFAERLRISPAIPAGRLRYESGDYTLFKQLVG